MYKRLIVMVIFTLSLFGQNDIKNDTYIKINSNIQNKIITLNENRYKIITFSKQIKDLRLSNNNILSVNFEDSGINPLVQIKAFAKKTGSVNLLITFSDKTTQQINFKVIKDITQIRYIVNSIAPNVELVQINKTMILKGSIVNNKIKNKIIKMIEDSILEIKIVDLLKVKNPDKMIRLKLYIAEINNNKGETIKNNWSLTNFNDGTTSGEITSTMLSSVTLSGGITAVANHTGSKFNTGLTLNYLKTNGVAKILDETTLITLENKESNFLAGGNLLIETSTVSADGQPVSAIQKFPYGLELKITVKDIVNKFVTLEIDTKSTTLDSVNGVGNLPAVKEKSIKTNVVIEDKATIVLGGLINNSNSKDWEKIPLLGDIPILGKLFQSKAFIEGKSELVFFITPTIVSANTNNQNNKYQKMKKDIIVVDKKKKKVKSSVKKDIKTDKKIKLSNEELHKERLNKIFGIQ